MKEAVELANSRIHVHAREHPEVRGMGTTATVAGVFGSDLYLAQVGDSRAYLIRNGRITQITKDQSLMQRLVEAGEITEEEAEQSERRNIILQALGPDPRVKVDLTRQSLRRGDLLVLCSDGLSGQVKKEEIAELAAATADLMDFCARLIETRQHPRRSGQHHRSRGALHRQGSGGAGWRRRRWAIRSIR